MVSRMNVKRDFLNLNWYLANPNPAAAQTRTVRIEQLTATRTEFL